MAPDPTLRVAVAVCTFRPLTPRYALQAPLMDTTVLEDEMGQYGEQIQKINEEKDQLAEKEETLKQEHEEANRRHTESTERDSHITNR